MALYVSGAQPYPVPLADATDEQPMWWATPYGRWRLSVEVEAMRRFDDFEISLDGHGLLTWQGWLESTFDARSRYLVRVTYPYAFPDAAPDVAIEDPPLASGTPHLVLGNRPCLYRSVDGPRYGYDPARTTAATLVAWTALWIHAYETWRVTGSWPGRSD